MSWQDESDEVIITEPILAQKDVKGRIDFVEPETWTVKETVPGHGGEPHPALKLTVTITDDSIKTEHENSRPRLTIEHRFNLDKYPYLDKKSGTVRFMGRQNLYDLEEAFGFEPVFTNGDGQPVDAYVTRNGRKVAPKGEGIHRKPNAQFMEAYFTQDGSPKLDAWINKDIYMDVAIEVSDQFGDKNRITRFKGTPVTV